MLQFGTARGRWVIAATALGSGIVFLDGTVVNIALPRIAKDLDASLAGIQWTVNAYFVTLSALLLLGGSLGDHFGRRKLFVIGLAGFTVASALCALAPSTGFLIGARAVQGTAGAMLVPGSLSIIASSFEPHDRGAAIGAWSGLAGVSTAIGPFLGGWLIEVASWRWIFLLNLPLAAVAIAVAIKHVPETKAHQRRGLDFSGAITATTALAFLSYAAINHAGVDSVVAALVGGAALVAFLVIERRAKAPMMPLSLFQKPQFAGANLVTLAVYAALSGALFLLTLQLQDTMQYSPLEAGAATVPFTVLMLALSSRAGRVSERIGPKWPMTIGPLCVAMGMALASTIDRGSSYATGVFPSILLIGLGMSITVAPLTTAVLADVDEENTGIASGVNNAVSRFAGLVAVAGLPVLAGMGSGASIEEGLRQGYATALVITAVACVVGAGTAMLTVRSTT